MSPSSVRLAEEYAKLQKKIREPATIEWWEKCIEAKNRFTIKTCKEGQKTYCVIEKHGLSPDAVKVRLTAKKARSLSLWMQKYADWAEHEDNLG